MFTMFSPFNKIVTVLVRTQCPNYFKYRSYATRKRFFRSTGIVQNESNWEVTLDHRRLKTPGGGVLKVPSEPLARAIAAEWDAQTDVLMQPTMHLTALCNTAQDNPGKLTSQDIVSYLLDYYATDTLLFCSDEVEELKRVQETKWGPIMEWFEKRFNITQEISKCLEPPPVTTDTQALLARHLLSYNFPTLNAICFGAEALKSPILMLACVERRVDPNEAVLLARLEEEFQLAQWGRVPWAHELNQAELAARVAASLLVVQCSTERHTAKTKASKTEQTLQ